MKKKKNQNKKTKDCARSGSSKHTVKHLVFIFDFCSFHNQYPLLQFTFR